MQIISLEEAKTLGLKLYFHGKPCRHGHLCERYTASSSCVECRKLYGASHREEDRTGARKRYAANREKKRAQAVKRGHKFRAVHHERLRISNIEKHKRARVKNREKRRAYDKKHHANNTAMHRAKRQRYRARKNGAGGSHSARDIAEIRSLQKDRCARCRLSLREKITHVDHILPLSLGGSNERKNIQLLCSTCNIQKGARHPADDARVLGLLI